MRTEASQRDHNEQEEYKEILYDQNLGENRMAQSERVKRTTKSSTYYNYLNNRMSVRIKYGGNDKPSLAKRLMTSVYSTKEKSAAEEEFDFVDLENPLLGDHQSNDH